MRSVSLTVIYFSACALRDANFYSADERGTGVWDDFHIVDGRLITGQNPQSSSSTAQAVVEAFEKL